ncbi:hypothetical protein EK21DRAFT_104209 [Setomelanomma holmii]|uniref:Copper acquisition factor BIM1-like domain-containing protein n=1 Tax=Setomelanomma holmii TaxID=210430 RepID=A0A9P4LH54_9PLEO|nr:hypothetical protein EK21DRAFT_104209 [Setomelanomma holmii]
MLDENLPTFFLKPSADKVKHHESYYFTQNGSEPEAHYALHHVDPSTNDAKNTYAVALFDSHRPDILFGEVLAKPGWTHPTLSQEEIRRNGGVPPPPQPIYPTEFAIQLYNPDNQVIVKQQTAKWSSTVIWEFSLPQITFRMPSSSDLDRTQTDPGADANTPRVNFAWRREGRLGKDMTCYMTGKSTDPTGKKAKKSKEPDIAVAMFSGLKEMTIMEPNLYRVELEDYKGLEVVLLLGAAVIRDLFFSDLHEQFHISDAAVRKNSAGLRARKGSSPLEGPNVTQPIMTPKPPPPPAYSGPLQYPPEKVPLQPAGGAGPNAHMSPLAYNNSSLASKRHSLPPLQTNSRPTQPHPLRTQQNPQQPQRPLQSQRPRQPQPQPQIQQYSQRPQQQSQGPRLDPRAQWEIDAETARLKAQVEAEAREQKKQAEAARKARRKQEAEEERKTLHFLEQEKRQKEREEKERRRKQAEIDKETERLKKQFGDQSNLLRPSMPQQGRHSAPLIQGPWQTQRPPPAPRPAPLLQQWLTEASACCCETEEELLGSEDAERDECGEVEKEEKYSAAAHFQLLQPIWRGDSFAAPASQYTFPCAGVNATASDSVNRTAWPLTGGSVVFNGSHPWAYTFVNLALGVNGSSFNISLVPGFNQTGPGVFCLRETGRSHLEAGLKAAGYSGLNDSRLDGVDASVQVVQLGERGSALYNVGHHPQAAEDEAHATPSGSATPAASSGVASQMGPVVGSGLFAAVLAWGLL